MIKALNLIKCSTPNCYGKKQKKKKKRNQTGHYAFLYSLACFYFSGKRPVLPTSVQELVGLQPTGGRYPLEG